MANVNLSIICFNDIVISANCEDLTIPSGGIIDLQYHKLCLVNLTTCIRCVCCIRC